MLKTAELSEGFDGKSFQPNQPAQNSQQQGGKTHKGGHQVKKVVNQVGMLTFTPPRRNKTCRICVTLDSRGDTKDLYDQH